jgi:phosphopantetheinyl transferase
MFHGPAYQGVAAFKAIGDNGIDGTLRVPSGKGALLDNMGQLAGYWVMEQPSDCLAMPIGVDRIRFFAPDPLPGELTQAQVRIRQLDALNCVTDHQLRNTQGQLCVVIDGWRTRRYQMDQAFWVASRQLSHLQASQSVPPNVALFDDRYDTAILRDYLSRRYLSANEREVYDGLPPRRRRQWLAGRVAAKDAVRAWLRQHRGVEAIWPQEMCIVNDESGAPQLRANVTDTVPDTLKISIAHKNLKGSTLAVAIVDEQPVGIDIEMIELRPANFIELTFSSAELALLNGADAATEHTRGWVAKEAIAKLQGTGLQGRPQDFAITARDGDCFCVNGYWVVTHALRDCIVGWSLGLASHSASALKSAAAH